MAQASSSGTSGPIPALRAQSGHQFVVYGDACSGRPGHLHEQTFAAVNAVIRRLEPKPDFILFAGDEIAGITADIADLRAQWRYWLDVEMAWFKDFGVPMWHATSNHTTYDPISEGVFTEMLGHLPRNGPPGQEGMSYWVRRGDLLIVFVHTLASPLGGEGFVETGWLRDVLQSHADARHKLVVGHHPAFSINGFSGPYGRDIGPESAGEFWDVLVEGGVLAYFCSHILAFDVQVHRGVLQVCTAGAGTAHRMPEGIEYLHAVQASLDADGLRYQVLDRDGIVREQLAWPLHLPSTLDWQDAPHGESPAPFKGNTEIVALRIMGTAAADGLGAEQTLLTAYDPAIQAKLWIGLRGKSQRLTVTLAPEVARSSGYWLGPVVAPGESFDFRFAIHPQMGPGGLLLETNGVWSSLLGAAPWGGERLDWPGRLAVGHAQHGPGDRAFRGDGLTVSAASLSPPPVVR